MTPKIIAFILGLAIGAAACAVALKQKNTSGNGQVTAAASQPLDQQIADLKKEVAATKAQLEQANADNDKLSARVQEVMQHESSAQAAEKNGRKNPLAEMFGGDGTNKMSQAMNDMMKAAAQQQMEAKFAGMKARLNLTPEQEQAIRDIMDKQATMGIETAQKMFKGELSKEEMARTSNESRSEKDLIKALLTPEQVVAYDEYEKEEKTRMTRLVANSELMQLQGSLQLNDDQQDKVFEVLANHAQGQMEMQQNFPASGMDRFREQARKKAEDLRAILTPEQFERYQRFQEQQFKMIEAFMPKE